MFTPVGREDWLKLVNADLKGAAFERKLVTHTYEGLHVQPLYTEHDGAVAAEWSGIRPYTRGSDALGNVSTGWDIRQEYAQADPGRAGEAIGEDLGGGVTSVVLRLDACARAGLDPTDAYGAVLAAGDGIAAYTVDDLDRALTGVHLEMIGVHLEAGAAFVPAAGLLCGLWARRGVLPGTARGSFQADPLAVLARDGHLPYTLEEGLGRMVELARFAADRYPGVTAVRVGTAPYHHAGATASQDLAMAMATGIEYLRAMTRAGMSVDAAAAQMTFSMAVGCHTFLAIAKLRAARRVWARVIEACGGSERAGRMRMYVRTSKRVLTTRDPWVNMLRNTACVMAAGLAGADAIGSTPFDAPLGEPSELGRRLARNTHHLLMEESGVHQVCDPAGGSYAVERLTDELCEKAWVILQAIEARGGMAGCLTSGWVHGQIDAAAQPRMANVATRRDVVVGVSDYPGPADKAWRKKPVDRGPVVRAACERLAKRGPRPGVGQPGADRVAWAVSAAGAGMSIGEMSAALRRGREEASLPSAVHVHPYAEPFEHLRDAADHFAEECGRLPRAVLAMLGTPADRLARVNFCTNLLQSGGFEVVTAEAGSGGEAVAEAVRTSGARVVVIAGPDGAYAGAVGGLAAAAHGAGAVRVVLAGASEAEYREAGVDRFVFVKCDVVALLSDLLGAEGVHT
jgi:methylmalonyl-CoA mutase